MQKFSSVFLFFILVTSAQAQNPFAGKEISINGFRNPSVGLEYRQNQVSVHAGYYPTAFKSGVNTNFIKTGATLWFLPVDKKEIPSSFYAGVNYLRGLSQDYENKNAVGVEVGFRWMIWKGLNFRLGVIGVAASGESFKVNPTPGLSYSIKL